MKVCLAHASGWYGISRLIAERKAQVNPLRPPIRSPHSRRRPCIPDERARRDLRAIDPEVDLISGPGHITPVQEGVADPGLQVGSDLVADVQTDFRDDRKGVVREA